MKKIDKTIHFLQNHLHLLRCPQCNGSFDTIAGNTLQCHDGHTFDISRKGTINFLTSAPKNEYNREMLQARNRISQAGFFTGIEEAVLKKLNYLQEDSAVLDVGCGEGSVLARCSNEGLKGIKIGFDISKDAIQLAANHDANVFWFCADLAHAPFASRQYEVLLNILSPSNYAEFKRLLSATGQLFKVIPAADYLKELRQILYKDRPEKLSYSNTETIQKFQEHFTEMQQIKINYTFPLTRERYQELIKMTPLSWGAHGQSRLQAENEPLKEITVDLLLLIGRKQNME